MVTIAETKLQLHFVFATPCVCLESIMSTTLSGHDILWSDIDWSDIDWSDISCSCRHVLLNVL